jgi:hypothetical protein
LPLATFGFRLIQAAGRYLDVELDEAVMLPIIVAMAVLQAGTGLSGK